MKTDRLLTFSLFCCLFCALLTFAKAASLHKSEPKQASWGQPPVEDSSAECLDCHEQTSPNLVADYRASRHYQLDVGCVDCHGSSGHGIAPSDTFLNGPGNQACQKCHADETAQHRASAHFQSFGSMLSSGSYQVLSKEMAAATCQGCHNVNQRCDACHKRHRFDAAEARRPSSCLPCHKGLGVGQYDYYSASQHGVLYQQNPQSERAPGCVTCHLDRTHNVSLGITRGGVGIGNFMEGEPNYNLTPARIINAATFELNRSYMLNICSRCHATKYAQWQLQNADSVTIKAQRLLGVAKKVVTELVTNNLIEPLPQSRPAHPSLGSKVALGNDQTFSNISKAEAIFYRMLNFEQPTTFKSAYHFAPGYTNSAGWLPLNQSLDALRHQALHLREHRVLRSQNNLTIEDRQNEERHIFLPDYQEELK